MGSTLFLIIEGCHVGFTGRGFWRMVLVSLQWTVGRMCGKDLDGRGFLLESLMWVLQAEEEILDIGCRTEISRKKTFEVSGM
jgi:hypothetical protein